MPLDPSFDFQGQEISVFAMKKCQHCCERPLMKTSCQAASVCEPVHALRNYEESYWGTWLKYAAYTTGGLGGAFGLWKCWGKFRSRRRVSDDEKDNWEDEAADARNREISENFHCFVYNM